MVISKMLITDTLLKFTKEEYKKFNKAKLDTLEKEQTNACLSLLTRIAAVFETKGLISNEDREKIHSAAFGE